MPAADGSMQADAAGQKLSEIEKALRAEIQRILLQLDTGRGTSDLINDAEALANASKVRAQVVDAMRTRGLEVVVKETERLAIEAAQAVADDTDFGEFTPDISRDIERIISGQMDEVAKHFNKAVDEIAAAMRLGVTSQAPLDELIAEVARISETTIGKAQAAVDTAIMGAARDVALEAAKDGQDAAGEAFVMLYLGPSDAKTREFCRHFVGKAVLLDDMGDLDNDTDLPADIFGGGYNCRHAWAAMTLADAEAEGIAVVKP